MTNIKWAKDSKLESWLTLSYKKARKGDEFIFIMPQLMHGNGGNKRSLFQDFVLAPAVNTIEASDVYRISITASPAASMSRRAGSIFANASSNTTFRQLPRRTQTTWGGMLRCALANS